MQAKYYQDKVGIASLNVKKAVAGSNINCLLTYKVGKLGIDDSGSFKVLFRIVSDCAEIQFNNPESENYVKFSSNNKEVIFKPSAKSTGCLFKQYVRPWSKGFTVNITNGYLKDGDVVYVEFKNWRIQTFSQKKFTFKFLVDPFATGEYIEVKNSPFIEIVPDIPYRLAVVAPTVVQINKKFEFLVKLEDRWGNPCSETEGEFYFISKSGNVDLPNKVKFKNGRALVEAKVNSLETVYIAAKFKHLISVSNPIICVKKNQHGYFWADLHWQSEETVGTNSLNDNLIFARDYAFVDVVCPQHNDFQIDNSFWKTINQLAKKYTKEGKFVVLPGYEWSGNTHLGGDRNVLYKIVGMPIYRSSHALINDFHDIKTDALTANDLFKRLDPRNALVIAHVGGRYSDLRFHDEKVERLVEIHSDWGTFEWFAFDALEKGYKVGFAAGSDCHDGRPGASFPSYDHFNNLGGLTCILASKLDRKNIFEALNKRHCFATTGSRIYLNVQLLSGNKVVGMMGDFIKNPIDPIFRVSYVGTSILDRIEIYNKSKLIRTFFPHIKSNKTKNIKIVWSGSKTKGRNRNFSWLGNLKLEDNNILKIEKINFFRSDDFVNYSSNSLNWRGNTTGGLQGIIMKVQSNSGKLKLKVNNSKDFELVVAKITQNPIKYKMGGLDAQLEIYQVDENNKGIPIQYNFEFQEFKNLTKGENAIFAKIIQRDGHLAWSSPIFL